MIPAVLCFCISGTWISRVMNAIVPKVNMESHIVDMGFTKTRDTFFGVIKDYSVLGTMLGSPGLDKPSIGCVSGCRVYGARVWGLGTVNMILSRESVVKAQHTLSHKP